MGDLLTVHMLNRMDDATNPISLHNSLSGGHELVNVEETKTRKRVV